MANSAKRLARRDLSTLDRDDLEALVVALTPDFDEDLIAGFDDERLTRLSISLTEIRRETVRRARYVQSLQDERAAAAAQTLALERAAAQLPPGARIVTGEVPDESTVG